MNNNIDPEYILQNMEDAFGGGMVSDAELRTAWHQAVAEAAKEARAKRETSIKAKYADETAAGRQAAKANGWCPLDGTPAQRRWATSIRVEQIEKLTKRAGTESAVEAAGQVGSSTFWIEHREAGYSSLVDALTDPAVVAEIAKTKRKAVAQTSARADAALAKISAARLVKKLEYLLSFTDLLIDGPASQKLGSKIGQLVQDGKLHRIFAETDGTLRIITGPATGVGPKTNSTLKVTPEMLLEMETF